MADPLPYTIAVLCYLFDAQGRLLLLHRRRPPNRDLYSPVGGKLIQEIGESPQACALREIQEETGLAVVDHDLHLAGIVSETAFNHQAHWLMFLYEVTKPVVLQRTSCPEGTLEWHPVEALSRLPIPATDREVIWPLFCRYRGRFFTAHIDCSGDSLSWRLHQPLEDVVSVAPGLLGAGHAG